MSAQADVGYHARQHARWHWGEVAFWIAALGCAFVWSSYSVLSRLLGKVPTDAVAGFCVAVTGVLVAGFAQNVNLQVAGTYTFDAIAAILVGGSAVTGGWGSVGRTVIGALIIATVTDMLLLVGASTGMQILVKGLIVTMVVVLLHLSRRERRSP